MITPQRDDVSDDRDDRLSDHGLLLNPMIEESSLHLCHIYVQKKCKGRHSLRLNGLNLTKSNQINELVTVKQNSMAKEKDKIQYSKGTVDTSATSYMPIIAVETNSNIEWMF